MPWTKLKSIILLILVVTNLCLLTMVLGQNIQNSQMQRQIWEDTLDFLQDRGVAVQEDSLPRSVSISPRLAERDLEWERVAAEALLQGEASVEFRGGEVYRYYNEQGTIQFHSDGTFSAQLEPGVCPVGEDPAMDCAKVLEHMGFEGTMMQKGSDQFVFRQDWKEIPLFDMKVTVVCQGGSLVAMTGGRRLVGQPRQDTTRQTISVTTALVSFVNGVSDLGDVCNQISSIEQGYGCMASMSSTMILTPVWQVTTDTATYRMDMVSGVVSRADS